MKKLFYSNCLKEAIKYKIHNKDAKIKFKLSTLHFYCEHNSYIIDFHNIKELNILKKIWYLGYIRKRRKNT